MGLYQREIIHKGEKKQEQTEATDEETLIKPLSNVAGS